MGHKVIPPSYDMDFLLIQPECVSHLPCDDEEAFSVPVPVPDGTKRNKMISLSISSGLSPLPCYVISPHPAWFFSGFPSFAFRLFVNAKFMPNLFKRPWRSQAAAFNPVEAARFCSIEHPFGTVIVPSAQRMEQSDDFVNSIPLV
ncbi:hypothetical protein [Caldibacillus debilis]|uniref:hypothetical protein n=1 Tax=Caldibacillus debilis TaxID=301148 RepID=UPI0023F108B4|nr:hypothetical protein [Caldibacillus debilis]